MSLAGRVVPLVYPSAVIRQVPESVKSWDGFKGANATLDWPNAYTQAGDWSAINQAVDSLPAEPTGSPVWKTRIFILTQLDNLIGGEQGQPYEQVRQRLNPGQLDSVLRALARFSRYMRASTGGAINPSLDVTIDSDPVVFDKDRSAWVADYLASRTNRGSFEAEDKAFRGPFPTVILITPTRIDYSGEVGGVVAATPALVGEEEAVGLESQLASELIRQSAMRLQGWRINPSAESLKSPATAFPAGTWRTLQATFEPNFEQVKELYDQNSNWTGQGTAIAYPSRLAPYSANVSLSVAEDSQRGSVLKMSESSEVRSGGFTLPYKDIDPAKTPFLTFWVKTNSRDNLALFAHEGSSQMREIPWSAVHDGSWQAVTVDLRGPSTATIKRLTIGAPRKESEREQIGEIAYQFDDFQFLDSGQATPAVDAATQTLVKKALDARAMSAADLAKESSDFVILNGLIERTSPFAAADEAGLMQLSKSVNVRIAGLALRRLAELGTPTAKAEVLRLITSSPFDYVKRVAAELVAGFGDPKLAGILSRLYAAPSWQNRMAGARAIASMSGDETEVIAMTFLQELDPQVRLTVTKYADPNNAVVRKRFLWSAVNDPSDAVRTESAWRLIHSNTPSAVAEGYKLIRDDSVGVRLELLRRFQLEPSPAHVGAIRIALADSSPRVRAAALRALAAQQAEVSLDEISNVFDDKFPAVQHALLDLAAAKKITLPPIAIANLRASIDRSVAARVGEE